MTQTDSIDTELCELFDKLLLANSSYKDRLDKYVRILKNRNLEIADYKDQCGTLRVNLAVQKHRGDLYEEKLICLAAIYKKSLLEAS